MSTHNIYFRREVRKILCGYPLLSVAMESVVSYVTFVLSLFVPHVCFGKNKKKKKKKKEKKKKKKKKLARGNFGRLGNLRLYFLGVHK